MGAQSIALRCSSRLKSFFKRKKLKFKAVKKHTIKFFALSAILTLLLPPLQLKAQADSGAGVFDNPQLNSEAGLKVLRMPEPKFSVKVVDFASKAKINFKESRLPLVSAAGCSTKVFKQSSGIQNPDVVNLNQPAQCFSLKLSEALPVAELKVAPLNFNFLPLVAVIANLRFDNFKPNPFTRQEREAVLVYGVLTVLLVLLILHYRLKGLLAIKSLDVNKKPSIYFLQLLRC